MQYTGMKRENPFTSGWGPAKNETDDQRHSIFDVFRSVFLKKDLQFFDSNPHTVPGFYCVTFGNINVEPQGIRSFLSRILGHQAVLEVINIGNEFYLSIKLKNFCHDKREK
jgi:hypothetical protein